MNAVADKYADQEIGSIFLYTHEAHPGENYLHLTSMEQKFEHARALRDVYGVTRPILLDALDGACHRAYGSMPNMSWIFNRAGMPVYKSDWTDSLSVDYAIRYLLEVGERRSDGQRMAPFNVERMDYRVQDREDFYKGLERNGPKAVREFDEAF
ncbi:MAG: hypothetical protein DWQ07_02415 [Chloroflexi bacterium]|nr:MAG: hypothetical protein DWQ07_02415 [Chloroflexota bacterium]MBL1193647.1 hypothetical protein [Chloroflexota bacterium]NOH10939.1 hypothetical protein [Chloroflexota bacterium]